MGERLNILCQSSDFYAPFCGVMLESLFYNNQDIETIKVYLISDAIKQQNLEKFNELSKKYCREIEIIDGEKIGKQLEECGCPKFHNSYATYFKLFASKYINDNIDRLLYVDCDMIINGSLKELLNLNMNGKILGMALDILSDKYKKYINFVDRAYHNAGLILFDFAKWKQEYCIESVTNHLIMDKAKYVAVDQDIVNVLFYQNIFTLDLKYNMPIDNIIINDLRMLKKIYGIKNYYSEEEFTKALNCPVVYHYNGYITIKPWFQGRKDPIQDEWDQYLLQSPWKDLKKIKFSRPFKNKCQRILFDILPRSMFAFINNIAWHLYYNKAAKKYNLK